MAADCSYLIPPTNFVGQTSDAPLQEIFSLPELCNARDIFEILFTESLS